jgi:hypothetical protein
LHEKQAALTKAQSKAAKLNVALLKAIMMQMLAIAGIAMVKFGCRITDITR